MVAGIFGAGVAHENLVGVVAAGQPGGGQALADLDALDGVDAHHRGGEVGVQLAVDRRADPGGHAARHDLDHCADRVVVVLAQPVQILRPFGHGPRVGAPEVVVVDAVPVETGAVDGLFAHLHHVALDLQPRCQLFDRRARHAAGGNAGGGFPGGTAPAAAIVAQPVFLVIGYVGMAGPEGSRDLAVVLRPLVSVADHQLDRCAGGGVLEHAGQDFHRVGFIALGCHLVLAGAAAVQPVLQHRRRQRHARRAAIHRRPQRRAVALAPGGGAEQVTVGVQAHGWRSLRPPRLAGGAALAKPGDRA